MANSMFASLVKDAPVNDAIPEVTGTLAVENDHIVLRIPAAQLNPERIRRTFTDKAGKTRTGSSFKLLCAGMVDDLWLEFGTGGFKSVCTLSAKQAK